MLHSIHDNMQVTHIRNMECQSIEIVKMGLLSFFFSCKCLISSISTCQSTPVTGSDLGTKGKTSPPVVKPSHYLSIAGWKRALVL